MKLFKGDDGRIYRATNYEPVTRESIVAEIEDRKAEITDLMGDLERLNELDSGLPVEDQTATEPAPAEQPASVPEQPAPTPVDPGPLPEAAPVADPAPAPVPVVEVDVSVDAAPATPEAEPAPAPIVLN